MLGLSHYGDDWRRCWHRGPMKLLALGGAIQGAMVTCPAAVLQYLPQWVLQSASVISFVCIVLAGLGIGKETRTEQPGVRNPNP